MRITRHLSASLLTALAALAGCNVAAHADEASGGFTARERKLILGLSPLPAVTRDTTNLADGKPTAIALGAKLFMDKRLSGSGEFSCATCHDPQRDWTDGLQVSKAAGPGTRNTPSLWNVAFGRWFFWDGRADSLWSQALHPIEKAHELNSSRLQIAHAIADNPDLREMYQAAFGPPPDVSDPQRFPPRGSPTAQDEQGLSNWWTMSAEDRHATNVVFVNAGKALAAFQATILSGPAPFDRFVADMRAGDAQQSTAISVAAKRGLKTFVGKGNCVICHSGPEFTNKEFHDIRVPQLLSAERHDEGRYDGVPLLFANEFVAAGIYSDDPEGQRAQSLRYLENQTLFHGQFKTPSLRNVARTAPYMHEGQFATLRDVVRYYSTLDGAADPAHTDHLETIIVPLNLSDVEIDEVVAFLESLSSAVP